MGDVTDFLNFIGAVIDDRAFGRIGQVLERVRADDGDYDQVVGQVADDSADALTGSVVAQDRQAIEQATERLRFAAGNFYVNDKPTGAVVGQQPFGGARGQRHQRQGRLDAEPVAVGVAPRDQGDLRST